jgi:hypothetical protein
MVEEALPARIEFDGLAPAHQEVVVCLGQVSRSNRDTRAA